MGVFEDSLANLKDQVVSDFNAGVQAAPDKIINYVETIGQPKPAPANPANTGTKPGGLTGFFGKYTWWIVGGIAVLVLVLMFRKRRRRL